MTVRSLEEAKQLVAPFEGTWIKDEAASSSMDEVCELMCMSTLMQKAISLIRGLEIRVTGESVLVSVFSVLTWFKLSERYLLNGTETRNSRRDCRFGGLRGSVRGEPGRMELLLRWPEPYAGDGIDELTMPAPDVLHLHSTTTVNGRSVEYLQVYHRAPASKA